VGAIGAGPLQGQGGPTASSGGSLGLGILGFGALALGAFLMLVYRRRSRRGPAEPRLEIASDVASTPSESARRPSDPAPNRVPNPVVAATMVAATDASSDDDLAPVDDDAPLKRSRKAPARPTAPAAAAAAASARLFDAPPKGGVDRAKVGYRRVRISSEPDAVRSTELGRLDRGDEVEILDSHEGFLRVRTPDDVTGWILRHTILGT
jgi:hypothetical protein